MGKLIYSIRDLENASNSLIKGIDKAVLAAAFKIRDNVKLDFRKQHSLYKYGTLEYNDLENGIMVGKLQNNKVKIHALGSKENYHTYKTRFFVGGTVYRKNLNGNKGYIKAGNSVENAVNNANNILEQYINNVIK